MIIKRLILVLTLTLCGVPSISGQSPAPQDSAKVEQAKKAQEEMKKKALVLIEEVIRETQSLKLPENRIRIQLQVADLLWPRDERRAIALFKAAVSSFGELARGVESADPQYANLTYVPFQLRQEMVQVASRYDAALALDFLRASRNAITPQMRSYYGQPNLESQLEIRIANEAAKKNASQALSIAEASLSLGIDQETLDFVNTLQAKDKDAAERFLSDIIKKLRTEDFAKNPAAFYAATGLIRNWFESERSRAASENAVSIYKLTAPVPDKRAVQELANIVIDAAMNGESNTHYRRSEDLTRNWLSQLQPMMPDIEKLAPPQAPALRQKIAELEKLNAMQINPWTKYQELINTGTPDAILEALKDAPEEMQSNLYQQAAWKAINQGDFEQAREIARDKISDPNQRKEMMANIDRQLLSRAHEQEKLDEARALLTRLPSIEERVAHLCQFAANAAEKGDKATALQLFNEAQAMLSLKARNYAELQAQLQIARACSAVDYNKSVSITESAVDQLNELSAAATVLNGFDIQQYFRDDEFILSSGNNMSMMVQQVSEQLGPLALKDFDRARLVAERFGRAEMRARALLYIAHSALAAESLQEQETGSATGLNGFTIRRAIELR